MRPRVKHIAVAAIANLWNHAVSVLLFVNQIASVTCFRPIPQAVYQSIEQYQAQNKEGCHIFYQAKPVSKHYQIS